MLNRHLQFLVLTIVWSIQATAVTLPPQLVQLLHLSCVPTLLLHVGSDRTYHFVDKLGQLISELQAKFPLFREREREFLPVIGLYIKKQQLGGAADFLILQDLRFALERYLPSHVRAKDFSDLLDQGLKDMNRLQIAARDRSQEIKLSDLGISPQTKSLKTLIETFAQTKTPLLLANIETMLKAGLYHAGWSFLGQFPNDFQCYLPQFSRALPFMVDDLRTRLTSYFPFSVIGPNREKYPRGIYIADYINSPGVADWMILAMAQVNQDFTWQLDLLRDWYLGQIKPRLRSANVKLPEVTPELLQSKKYFFFKATAFTEYRIDFMNRSDGTQLTELDWVVFVDLFFLLGQIDAGLRAGEMAAERGRPHFQWQPENVVEGVGKFHTEQTRMLVPHLSELYTESELFGLISALNQSARFHPIRP